MTNQELAERLAEESLKRWGFLVVAYFPGRFERNRGKPTNYLWNQFKMPQPFVPLRIATIEEWKAQLALVSDIFGRPADPEYGASEYVAMVTD